MIYDLIELPMRKVSGELSSVLPRFISLPGIEDVDWYGRTIRLDGIQSGMHKYKSIEPMGSMTIERMFMTDEPIDFKKKWQTANINIYPIMFKVFKYPLTSRCEVYRYLNGSTNVLGNIDCYPELQTLNSRLANLVCPYGFGDVFDTRASKLIPHVISGNDDRNLSTFATMKEFLSDENDGFFYTEAPMSFEDMFPAIPKDHTEDLFLRDIKVSNLKPLLAPQVGTGIFRNVMAYVPTPFEITQQTVFNEECEMYRWCLHDLIQELERSVYTDMHFLIEFKDQHKVTYKHEVMSRYIGLSANNIHGTKSVITDIVEMLRKWACMTSSGTPSRVELWKNWAEEIFISITVNGITTNYYFDIVTYSLTNLSFVDILG